MKSYTDLEQSKKLAEILPLESADMYYKYVLPKSDRIIHTPEIGNPIDSLKWYNEGYTFRGKREPITLSEYCIPCWSLTALLRLMPRIEYLKPFIDLSPKLDSEVVSIYYHSEDSPYIVKDNLINAAFEMICWLKENKKL